MGMRLAAGLGVVVACWLLGGGPVFAETLPDGRAYEMVTPAANHEADVYVPLAVAGGILPDGEGGISTRLPFQVAANGEAVAYVGSATVGGIGIAGEDLGNEYLADRKLGGGWAQIGLQPAGREKVFYQGFSSDLSVGFLNAGYEEMEPSPLSAEAPGDGYAVLYAHNGASGSTGEYRPFFTASPTGPLSEFIAYNVPSTYPPVGNGQLEYAGASADLDDLLFEAHGALTPNASESSGANNLYVTADGRLSLVNVLPNGMSGGSATFGAPKLASGRIADPPDFQSVISSNGSRIFWTDLDTTASVENPTGATRLFMREDATAASARSVQIDASQGPGVGGGGRFWTASRDGSRVFFTDESQLTANSTANSEAEDLYEYDGVSGGLSDLSVDPHPGESAKVQGVLAASEDGSYVYFVAQGVLASNKNSQDAEAVSGGDNLYVSHEGGPPHFIATLSPEDDKATTHPGGPSGSFGDWQPGLGHRTAEVTPDGRSLVFESNNQSVEGYSPEVNGVKLQEVYVYEAEGDRLLCVSCNANHQPPLVTQELTEAHLGAFLTPSWSSTFLPRWISTNGSRVYFNSAEPLVSNDTNGQQDVYEWERDGSGGCTKEDGCVYLLSGGANDSAAWLIGGSESGDDIFIISRTAFVPEDGNEAYNVFDVRVGGVQSATPLACSETGCQGAPAPPPAFATPPSVTFTGPGNFPPRRRPTTHKKYVRPKKHPKLRTTKHRNRHKQKLHGRDKNVKVERGRHSL
jgi:hypothetical protein